VEVATFGKILGYFSPIFPPSAAGFASVALDAGGLLWRKMERSKSLVLQVGGLTWRWQRHSVKPFCWECSTTAEQAETQLRVVVPVEEEEVYNILSQLSKPPIPMRRLCSESYGEKRNLRKSELSAHKVKCVRWVYTREFTWSPRLLKTRTRSAATWQLRRQWYRPAVPFRHLRLTALLFPHEKIRSS
jgi:hypothetical protein